MTKKEIELLSKLDGICIDLVLSYSVTVKIGIGTYIHVPLTDNVSIRAGGLDKDMECALNETIDVLMALTKEI